MAEHLVISFRLTSGLIKLVIAGLSIFAGSFAQASEPACQVLLEVSSKRQGGEVEVKVQLDITSPVSVVWEVMTDYGAAAQYIRNLRKSEAFLIGPDKYLVKQVSWVGWGAFGTTIQTNYEVQLNPSHHQMSGHLISGDIKAMRMAANLVTSDSQRTVLHYILKTEPGSWIPTFLAEGVLRRQAQESFENLASEMQRRSPKCELRPTVNSNVQ